MDAHGRRTSSGVPSGGAVLRWPSCARVVAIVGPGCRAALHFSSDAVATEYLSGRPQGDSWNVLSEPVECVSHRTSRGAALDGRGRDRLKQEGFDDDEARTRIEGGYLRAPWPSLSLPSRFVRR